MACISNDTIAVRFSIGAISSHLRSGPAGVLCRTITSMALPPGSFSVSRFSTVMPCFFMASLVMVFSISAKAWAGSAISRMKAFFWSSSKPGKLVETLRPAGGTRPSRDAIGKTASAAAAGTGSGPKGEGQNHDAGKDRPDFHDPRMRPR